MSLFKKIRSEILCMSNNCEWSADRVHRDSYSKRFAGWRWEIKHKLEYLHSEDIRFKKWKFRWDDDICLWCYSSNPVLNPAAKDKRT